MIKKTVGPKAGFVVNQREKVGKISSDLMQKKQDCTKVEDLQHGMQEDYMKELMSCIDNNYEKYPHSFYVVVLTKAEKLMPNVFRNYFLARSTCPTPSYDQSVFRYNKSTGRIEYLWTVPDRNVCQHLKDNASQVVESEKMLLQFVLKFLNGTLLESCKKINKEQSDLNIIIQPGLSE